MEDLQAQFHLIAALRTFFGQRGFIDVLTPPMVENPGMETHIHPFKVCGLAPDKIDRKECYLHTSPEFHMKQLLSNGFEKIFTISYCFRDEPNSPDHRHQFLMLEWYRADSDYRSIMEDCRQLLEFLPKELSRQGVKLSNSSAKDGLRPHYLTVAQLFFEVLKIDILEFLELESIRQLILSKFPDLLPPGSDNKLEWDDYYFLLFLNYLEPYIKKKYPALILDEYPHHLSALSTLKKSDPRVCQRFELYLNGVEICNCFNELRDLNIQRERFRVQGEQKEKLYGIKLPPPQVLYSALERGMPPSAGVALGVERLLSALTDLRNPFWDNN
jgi:elongation factor P--(R)-beta-lysine ligase